MVLTPNDANEGDDLRVESDEKTLKGGNPRYALTCTKRWYETCESTSYRRRILPVVQAMNIWVGFWLT